MEGKFKIKIVSPIPDATGKSLNPDSPQSYGIANVQSSLFRLGKRLTIESYFHTRATWKLRGVALVRRTSESADPYTPGFLYTPGKRSSVRAGFQSPARYVEKVTSWTLVNQLICGLISMTDQRRLLPNIPSYRIELTRHISSTNGCVPALMRTATCHNNQIKCVSSTPQTRGSADSSCPLPLLQVSQDEAFPNDSKRKWCEGKTVP